MEGSSAGRCVRVYVGESDQVGRTPRYQAMLEYLRREGAAGATVTRGIAGFGANSQVHTASILALSLDLPVVLAWVDAPARAGAPAARAHRTGWLWHRDRGGRWRRFVRRAARGAVSLRSAGPRRHEQGRRHGQPRNGGARGRGSSGGPGISRPARGRPDRAAGRHGHEPRPRRTRRARGSRRTAGRDVARCPGDDR